MTLVDFGETLSQRPPGEVCAGGVSCHTARRRAIRLPSCFLLYQTFARMAEAAIAPDCRPGVTQWLRRFESSTAHIVLRLRGREVKVAWLIPNQSVRVRVLPPLPTDLAEG